MVAQVHWPQQRPGQRRPVCHPRYSGGASTRFIASRFRLARDYPDIDYIEDPLHEQAAGAAEGGDYANGSRQQFKR